MLKKIVLLSFILSVYFALNAAAAIYIVTSNGDSGLPGELRWAMGMANASVGVPDTIQFNIGGGGLWTIFPVSQLPTLTDPAGVLIDGLSQPGASAGANPPSTATLLIEINGSGAGAAHGIWIYTSNNTIRGLIINNFQQDGIRVQGAPLPNTTYNNYIYCNFVGTDPLGMGPMGNGMNGAQLWAGIDVVVPPGSPGFAYNNTVERNLSSANFAEGISLSNCPPGDIYYNYVLDNYVGTNVFGNAPLGNINDGVYIGEGAHNNEVLRNIICDNGTEGVCIIGYAELEIYTDSNLVKDNNIGVDVNQMPMPNRRHGVSIGHYFGTNYWGGYARYNTIETNIIATNLLNGVMVWEHPNNGFNADHNKITQNSIYDNGTLGIDLQDDMVTFNDYTPVDRDSLANQQLNFPDSISANYAGATTTVSGALHIDSAPQTATVEVFKARVDLTGYGEGAVYLGSATPNSVGHWSVAVSGLVPGDSVTATTTDASNNTSEFAATVPVTGSSTCLSCTMDIRPDLVPCDNSVPIQFEIAVTNCGTNTIPVYAEIYPTIGDCPTGTVFDFNINRRMTSSLAPSATYHGYYYYYAGNRCGMGLRNVAIWVDVGPAVNNWIASCCDEFHFTDPFSSYTGPPKGVWGAEGTMFYEIGGGEIIPAASYLGQSYPNPFNAKTTIPFELPERSDVTLKIYNLTGQLVETLVDGEMEAGHHMVTWDASAYSSGVYFYTLQSANYVSTRKMNLVK